MMIHTQSTLKIVCVFVAGLGTMNALADGSAGRGSDFVDAELPDVGNGFARYGDINGDGNLDVVVSHNGRRYLVIDEVFVVGLGDGSGGVSSVYEVDVVADGADVLDAIPSDIDGDGDVDVVAMVERVETDKFDARTRNLLVTFLNDGAGNLSQVGDPLSVIFEVNDVRGNLVLGDIDGDGLRNDFVVNDEYDDGMDVYTWDPAGHWIDQGGIGVPGRGVGLVFADLDLDGDLDLLSADQFTNRLIVRRNIGNFNFGLWGGDVPVNHSPSSIAVADVNHDFYPDALVTDVVSGRVSVILNTGSGLEFLNQFDTGVNSGSGSLVLPRNKRIVAGDVTLDGHPDVVVKDSIFAGDGSGNFDLVSHSPGIYAFELIDMNGDGRLDISSSWLHSHPIISLNQQVSTVCEADLNFDGTLDFFDVSAFLNGYILQSPVADFTGDGLFDFFDVSAFLSAYNAGCP